MTRGLPRHVSGAGPVTPLRTLRSPDGHCVRSDWLDHPSGPPRVGSNRYGGEWDDPETDRAVRGLPLRGAHEPGLENVRRTHRFLPCSCRYGATWTPRSVPSRTRRSGARSPPEPHPRHRLFSLPSGPSGLPRPTLGDRNTLCVQVLGAARGSASSLPNRFSDDWKQQSPGTHLLGRGSVRAGRGRRPHHA
jgi:hypothetical protein